MTNKKIVLHFPPNLVDKPIIYKLSQEFGLEFNILKASVTPKEEGLLVLELKGEDTRYNSAIDYLKKEGVKVQPLSQDITLNLDKCTNCGLCIPICPVSALEKVSETEEIRFLKERCIACELCVKVCPYGALEVNFNL